jgi:membrane-associated phospholipid phosphatase
VRRVKRLDLFLFPASRLTNSTTCDWIRIQNMIAFQLAPPPSNLIKFIPPLPVLLLGDRLNARRLPGRACEGSMPSLHGSVALVPAFEEAVKVLDVQ